MSQGGALAARLAWPAGGDASAAAAAIRGWVDSEALRDLGGLSGWQWPRTARLDELVRALAQRSSDWDFRAMANAPERRGIPQGRLELDGRHVPDAVVLQAARTLGLVEAQSPVASAFTHVAVLGGAAKACVNRSRRAAQLLRVGVVAGTVVGLTAARRLGPGEREDVGGLGLGLYLKPVEAFSEADVVLAALREAFDLPTARIVRMSTEAPLPGLSGEELNAVSGSFSWPDRTPPAEVLIAPSSDPGARRTNTPDQLDFWAARMKAAGTELGPEHSVLLVTTQIYVPPQQIEAIRCLGLAFGCAITTCGVDARTASLGVREFGARDYLQEVRSTLRAADVLLRELPADVVTAA